MKIEYCIEHVKIKTNILSLVNQCTQVNNCKSESKFCF